MSIEIPADFVPFVHTLIASGRFQNEGEVVHAALQLMARQQQRDSELQVSLLEADQEIDRGEGTTLAFDEIEGFVQGVFDEAAQQVKALQRKP